MDYILLRHFINWKCNLPTVYVVSGIVVGTVVGEAVVVVVVAIDVVVKVDLVVVSVAFDAVEVIVGSGAAEKIKEWINKEASCYGSGNSKNVLLMDG